MKIYLVGGAVRDQLLGVPVKERDWVIVGGTPEELIAANYQPVGKEFPVFIHPVTHEEYALARTERKIAKGYKGFNFYAAPDVTLEDDLKRRDLTINAIAQDDDGNLIDPYGGQQDLRNKILRHVSPAFEEDPVRILRLARFAAKLPEFEVSAETNKLMQTMVEKGEVDALVAERVWQELSRALEEKVPERFFLVLNNCNALEKLFPGLTPRSAGMQALEVATQNGAAGVVRFAALLHALPEDAIKTINNRYRPPREYQDLAKLVANWHSDFANSKNLSAEEMLHLLRRVDALRRPDRFQLFLAACQAIYPQNNKAKEILEKSVAAIAAIDTAPLLEKNLAGKDFADALQELQIEALSELNS